MLLCVCFSAVFNYEEREMYNLVLQVEDNSPISRRQSDPSTVIINIINQDDERTTFNQTVYSESLRTIFGLIRLRGCA